MKKLYPIIINTQVKVELFRLIIILIRPMDFLGYIIATITLTSIAMSYRIARPYSLHNSLTFVDVKIEMFHLMQKYSLDLRTNLIGINCCSIVGVFFIKPSIGSL